MRKLATIIKVSKENLPNERTGEVMDFTSVTYLTSREDDEGSYGCDVRTSWIKGYDAFEKLKKYIHKPNQELILDTIATKNGDKYKLLKFVDIDLQVK